VIAPLTAAGHDTDTVVGEGLGGATDDAVFVAAQQAGRLLLTLDRGFGDIRRYPPGTHAGVVVLRLAEQSPAAVGAAVRRLVTEHDLDDLSGTVAIVEPERLRIRRAAPGER
jgi:predicted nuclease of predicted toxin-antitoxin system